jgi:hypothetical protein
MITIQAVYENGVLRPTQPLDLPDGKQVQVVIYQVGPTPHLSSLPPPTPEEQAYIDRLNSAKSLQELFAIMDSAPDVDEGDGEDFFEAMNENRRRTGERIPYPPELKGKTW